MKDPYDKVVLIVSFGRLKTIVDDNDKVVDVMVGADGSVDERVDSGLLVSDREQALLGQQVHQIVFRLTIRAISLALATKISSLNIQQAQEIPQGENRHVSMSICATYIRLTRNNLIPPVPSQSQAGKIIKSTFQLNLHKN